MGPEGWSERWNQVEKQVGWMGGNPEASYTEAWELANGQGRGVGWRCKTPWGGSIWRISHAYLEEEGVGPEEAAGRRQRAHWCSQEDGMGRQAQHS